MAIDDEGERGESREARALRLADRELEQLRGECDQLDAMLLYLQRRRDELEARFEDCLAERDRLEAELWDHAAQSLTRDLLDEPPFDSAFAEPFVIEPITDFASGEIELDVVPAPISVADTMIKRRVVPPDVSPGLTPPPTPSASELLAAWGLQPTPPDLSKRPAPSLALRGPALDSWELADDDTAAPEPRFVPIADTLRIAVVPGGLRARPRPRDTAPRSVPLVDTAPIRLAPRRLPHVGRGLAAG